MFNLYRNLPTFKGKLRFLRFLLRESYLKKETSFKLKKKNLLITVPNLIENVSFELFCNGEYETDYINYFISSIPVGGVFFDIGANIGIYSLTIAHHRPDIKIYAFEASPFVYNFLEKNIIQNKF